MKKKEMMQQCYTRSLTKSAYIHCAGWRYPWWEPMINVPERAKPELNDSTRQALNKT